MAQVLIHREMIHLKTVELLVRDTHRKGPAILCLHGRWGRGETWIDFMNHYGDHYRVIAPDQRGHGLSSKPISKYTLYEMAEDMAELVELMGIKEVIVVGHSMGGGVAGHLAAEFPHLVKALAILDKSANGPKSNPLPLEQIKIEDQVTKLWPLPFKSLEQARSFIRNDMQSDLSYDYFMSSLVETVAGYEMMFSTQAMAASVAYYEKWFDLLPTIKCPVMLIRSSSHEAVPDEDLLKMQSLLKDCTTHEIDHPDHNVHLSNKDQFYGFFDEFIKKINNNTRSK